jgi:hypothetical protein
MRVPPGGSPECTRRRMATPEPTDPLGPVVSPSAAGVCGDFLSWFCDVSEEQFGFGRLCDVVNEATGFRQRLDELEKADGRPTATLDTPDPPLHPSGLFAHSAFLAGLECQIDLDDPPVYCRWLRHSQLGRQFVTRVRGNSNARRAARAIAVKPFAEWLLSVANQSDVDRLSAELTIECARAEQFLVRSTWPTADADSPRRSPSPRRGRLDRLIDFARHGGLKGIQRRIIELICENGGQIRLADLAVAPEIQWSDPLDSCWNSARTALNRKIWRLGWSIATIDRTARLIATTWHRPLGAQK